MSRSAAAREAAAAGDAPAAPAPPPPALRCFTARGRAQSTLLTTACCRGSAAAPSTRRRSRWDPGKPRGDPRPRCSSAPGPPRAAHTTPALRAAVQPPASCEPRGSRPSPPPVSADELRSAEPSLTPPATLRRRSRARRFCARPRLGSARPDPQRLRCAPRRDARGLRAPSALRRSAPRRRRPLAAPGSAPPGGHAVLLLGPPRPSTRLLPPRQTWVSRQAPPTTLGTPLSHETALQLWLNLIFLPLPPSGSALILTARVMTYLSRGSGG